MLSDSFGPVKFVRARKSFSGATMSIKKGESVQRSPTAPLEGKSQRTLPMTGVISLAGAGKSSGIRETGGTYLYLGPLPFQTIDVSSDSSGSLSHPSPLSPTQELPRPQTTPPKPPKQQEFQSRSDTKVIRRTRSDRFDPLEYGKQPNGTLFVTSRVQYEEASKGFEVDSDFGTEYSWTAEAKSGRPAILKNEKHLVIQRVIDRDQIIDELFKGIQPQQSAERKIPSCLTPRQAHRLSRRRALPTFQSATSAGTGTPVYARLDTPIKVLGSENLAPQPMADYGPKAIIAPPSTPQMGMEGGVTNNGCDACSRTLSPGRKMRMEPCRHVVCSTCFSSAIAAVSVTCGPSRCTACCLEVASFEPVDAFNDRSVADHLTPAGATNGKSGVSSTALHSPNVGSISIASSGSHFHVSRRRQTYVLRIDNVAWDITPSIAFRFLPPDILPSDHPSPIHILLDRYDGRTKDYMYIEVKSLAAARLVLQTRQNALMPCGPRSDGRKRFVTICLVSHKELLDELRPRNSSELYTLQRLCAAAVAQNSDCDDYGNGIFQSPYDAKSAAHFIKNRHGPFYALMSILCHLTGKNSPAYWDLFHVTSGAIAALASCIYNQPQMMYYPSGEDERARLKELDEDQSLLYKLRDLFTSCFNFTPPSSPNYNPY